MSRLVHLIALIALVLAPTAMHRADAAPTPASSSHHGAAAADHCAGGTEQAPADDETQRTADCALACSAMAGAAAGFAAARLPSGGYDAVPAAFFAGTAPGSDPPPPRAS